MGVCMCECGLSISALISWAMLKKRPVLCGFMLLRVRESAMLGKHVYQTVSWPTGRSVGGPNSSPLSTDPGLEEDNLSCSMLSGQSHAPRSGCVSETQGESECGGGVWTQGAGLSVSIGVCAVWH